MKANKLTSEALELVAARFRVLGEPNRLRLIAALEQGEKNVSRRS
jgi:DNA-binding transcriptional ArsR family regulator